MNSLINILTPSSEQSLFAPSNLPWSILLIGGSATAGAYYGGGMPYILGATSFFAVASNSNSIANAFFTGLAALSSSLVAAEIDKSSDLPVVHFCTTATLTLFALQLISHVFSSKKDPQLKRHLRSRDPNLFNRDSIQASMRLGTSTLPFENSLLYSVFLRNFAESFDSPTPEGNTKYYSLRNLYKKNKTLNPYVKKLHKALSAFHEHLLQVKNFRPLYLDYLQIRTSHGEITTKNVNGRLDGGLVKLLFFKDELIKRGEFPAEFLTLVETLLALDEFAILSDTKAAVDVNRDALRYIFDTSFEDETGTCLGINEMPPLGGLPIEISDADNDDPMEMVD